LVLLHRIVLIKVQSQGRMLLYHRHSYVSLFYRVKAEKKRPNLLKVKIQDAYFFYKKSFKRTGPFCNSYQMQSMLNHISL
jgi:hypothetical protein